ncbi:MAG: hypothetical protein ACTSQY_07005 [Candidatus Odinarchaeia archaeon]
MPVRDNNWKGVKPSYIFLKEYFRSVDREKVEEGARENKVIERKHLDGIFLNESIQFLRLSIINLLAYKYVIKGNYYAWAKVTLYYSYFYVINCLLRLQKYAIIHINYINDSPLTIVIDRSSNDKYYTMKNCRGNQHDLIWKTFERYYRNLITEGIGTFFRDERTMWNYDLFYASQTLDKYCLDRSKIIWRTNFIDPNYYLSKGDPEADEYYYDLMADTGFEEAGAWDLIQYALEKFSNIELRGTLTGILDDISKIESSEDVKKIMISKICSLLK